MKIETLLHRQGGRCFYCRKILDLKVASIEHVVPQCLDGWEGFTNLVACCQRMNLLLSGLPPKHKIEILLNWWGLSPCPMDTEIQLGDAELHSGKYVFMATCLEDPVYLKKKSQNAPGINFIEVPDGFAEGE